ncbi:MAG: LytTR family DNA-binding domain-containing protein [Bacteroidota bacterium]
METTWKLGPALRYLPVIILIGLGIGIANHAIGFRALLAEAMLLNTITSICVGFPLVLIYTNADFLWQRPPLKGATAQGGLVVFGLAFALIGLASSEVELLVRTLGLNDGPYVPFSGGGTYVANAIISVILGFSFLNPMPAQDEKGQASTTVAADEQPDTVLETIPVNQGAAIHLVPVPTLGLLEAADKYAYLYTITGDKHLCDYSLSRLEQRLPDSFVRIHRSYIINTRQIARIKPFDKKRYLIEFTNHTIPAVKSSATYQHVLRELTRLA